MKMSARELTALGSLPRKAVDKPALPVINVEAPVINVEPAKVAVEIAPIGGPAILDLAKAMRELKHPRPKAMHMTVTRNKQTNLIESTHITFEYN